MKYKIAWRDNRNGNCRINPKEFELAEAETLCRELNNENPDVEHKVVPVEASAETVFPKAAIAPAPAFEPLTDSSPMPFGAHRDKPMAAVPASYLDFISGQPWLETAWPAVANYIRRSRKAIDQDLERDENE